MKQTGLRLFAAIVLAVISTACERGPASVRTDKPAATTPRAQTPVVSTSRPAPLSDKLRQQALTASLSLAESCRQMQQQIGELLTSPSAQTLQAARQSWQSLHAASHLTSPALGLAASNPNLFAALATNIQRAHQYPIAPGFLDGVQGYPASGLVHDISVPIRRETLLQQHGLTDDSEATVGLHVLEFLLYGDTGERSAEDYRQAQNGSDQLKVAELPQNRRRNLLQLSARLTCESIEQLAAHWQPSSATVATLLRLPASSQLELWRNALAASLAAARDTQHCEFAPAGCQLSIPALHQLIALIKVQHNGQSLWPAPDSLTSIEAQLESLQNTSDISAEEKQHHLQLILARLSDSGQTPGQK